MAPRAWFRGGGGGGAAPISPLLAACIRATRGQIQWWARLDLEVGGGSQWSSEQLYDDGAWMGPTGDR